MTGLCPTQNIPNPLTHTNYCIRFREISSKSKGTGQNKWKIKKKNMIKDWLSAIVEYFVSITSRRYRWTSRCEGFFFKFIDILFVLVQFFSQMNIVRLDAYFQPWKRKVTEYSIFLKWKNEKLSKTVLFAPSCFCFRHNVTLYIFFVIQLPHLTMVFIVHTIIHWNVVTLCYLTPFCFLCYEKFFVFTLYSVNMSSDCGLYKRNFFFQCAEVAE